MKTETLISNLITAAQKPLSMAAIAMTIVTGAWAGPESAAELLEQGIYNEETKGEVEAAVRIYEQIVADPNADPGDVAQAQLRLGLCHLKQGDKSRAVSALERLTRDFPDKEKLRALVEKQMPSLLDEIVKQVEQNYIKEVDRGDLMETAIRAIVGKLDKQSDFIGPRELAQLHQQIDQKLGGIGVRLRLDEASRQVVVETPLPGSPALKGGILAGDVIVQVNGQATADFPAGQEVATATARIQGQPGETVTLGVRHPASGAIERIQLVREVIRFTSVTGDRLKADLTWDFMLDDAKRIGYIHLAYVGRQSPEDMRAALTELKSRGLRALVLDLRNNPGGSLDESVAIADLFVESGILLTVKGRTGEARVYTAEPEGTFSGFPIAVLVNRNTASGGEIIAAGLQDHQRAIVVGERTYGQALVKNLFSLEGGKSALKLPTAAYYRPNGKNMHRYPDAVESDDWGVRPNEHYEVVGSAEEPEQFGKDRLRRSVLNGRAPEGAGFEDRVLRKALEYLEAPSGKPSSDR